MPTSVFAARIGATSRHLTIDGLRVHLLELGPSRGAPIVLVHGASGGAGWFWRNAPALAAAGRRVLLPDLPGFGRSHLGSGGFAASFAAYGRLVGEVLQALRLPRADVVGLSMGGAASLSLALERPDLVRNLVLVGSAGLGREVALPFQLLAVPGLGERLLAPDLGATRRFHARWLYGRRGRIDEDMAWYDYAAATVAGTARALLSLVRPEPRRFWKALAAGQAPVMLLDRLPGLRVRTLLVWGRRDRVFPERHAHAAALRIPGARVAIHEDAGHMPHYEEPERFNRTLLRFLAAKPA